MFRQSLKMFVESLQATNIDPTRIAQALQKLAENDFHVKLRNELIMLPIPKAKMFDRKVPVGLARDDYEDKIIEKQTHILQAAFERVSFKLNINNIGSSFIN